MVPPRPDVPGMTVRPVTTHPDHEFGSALRLMHEHGFRHVPVVDPVPTTLVMMPAGTTMLTVPAMPTPLAYTAGAVARVPGTARTSAPAAAFAREALAPEIVTAEPSVPSAENCKVEAVALLAVMQSAPMETI